MKRTLLKSEKFGNRKVLFWENDLEENAWAYSVNVVDEDDLDFVRFQNMDTLEEGEKYYALFCELIGAGGR